MQYLAIIIALPCVIVREITLLFAYVSRHSKTAGIELKYNKHSIVNMPNPLCGWDKKPEYKTLCTDGNPSACLRILP